MRIRWLTPFVRRMVLREWLYMLVGMLLLAMGLGSQNGLGRLDHVLYDQFLTSSTKPARDDIIIVAIDDFSLAELGRWPWPRTWHANLIDTVMQAHPRMIGLDIILSEPERAQSDGSRPGDAALQRAIRQSRRTVLPAVTTNTAAGFGAALPIPELQAAAAAIGHINLEHDNDGVVRSVFLHEGRDNVLWSHFSLALSAFNAPDGTGTGGVQPIGIQHAGPWQRADRTLIPFAGNNGHFQSVPYAAVLRGEVPPQFFTDKYVLVGATALGMADAYPTPVSGQSGAMPGVEIQANILAGLLDHRSIAITSPWQTALLSAAPVLIAMLGYLLLAPRMALLFSALLIVLVICASYLALRAGLWIAPSAALIMLLLAYPLWSWRRLEAAIAYLGQEFTRLDQEPHLLSEPALAQAAEPIEDVLERRINAMKNAARRVRDLRQFISDSLNNLPDAILVAAVDGRILLANRHANDYFGSIGIDTLTGMLLPELLGKLQSPQPVDLPANAAFAWSDMLDLSSAVSFASGIAARDACERDLLVKIAPCHSANATLTGWLVSVADISTIRAAEHSRDETLRFLSHDMRAPQASILALLELQTDPSSAIPQHEFFFRIEKAARKTLGLADNFVQLARAESQEYRLEEVDFHDLLFDAVDEMWTLANGKNIKLATDIAEGEFIVLVDRALMTRALVNLLSNAVNYSPEGTQVSCMVRQSDIRHSPFMSCSISDQGYGIAPADQARLFRRFVRVTLPHQPRHDGSGLGLVFVKTVVERHDGKLHFASQVGTGTTFTLHLPLLRGAR
ncbi:MAG TPA: CHASE2 domain-containing protein [Paucimonas sp.]|nr:CHASE2 domain-containing protein [Paucimonas sp.]